MRLIDADKLKEMYLELVNDEEVSKIRKLECLEAMRQIDAQPTAYDVDKQLISETLEIVSECVDDCICTYDFEVFGRKVKMIPVETVHQLLERIEHEALGEMIADKENGDD